MKKKIWLFIVLTLFALPLTVFAQNEGLKVEFTRDWGYGGFAGDIQGKFSLRVTGPETLVEVRYMLDDQVMAVISAPPFNFQFNTDSFPPGPHTLTVIGVLQDGTELAGPEYKRIFLSAEDANAASMKIILPILVVAGGVTLFAVIVPLVMGRKGNYKLGQYGIAGGAVCRQCQLPFSRSLFAPNMLFGKLQRCPHCGKWAIVRAASAQELAEAEKRFLKDEGGVELNEAAQAENWKKSLDDTRYE